MAPHRPFAEAELPLEFRDGIPEELQILLRDYPRDDWPSHPDFNGLTAFWLERHITFRKLMKLMRSDSESLVDRTMDPSVYKQRLARLGTTFVGQLKGHHQIEDDQYFPMLEAMEMRLQRGFEMLDRDHHELDRLLRDFADGANLALLADDDLLLRDAVGVFRADLLDFDRMLERHLTDEEDLLMPVILKHKVG